MESNAILISWDHKESVPVDEVSAAAQRGFVHMYTVDVTFSDSYSIVASKDELEPGEVQATFERINDDWAGEPAVPQLYRMVTLAIEVLAGQSTAALIDELKETMGRIESFRALDVINWDIQTGISYAKVEE